jgi:hypothetical protein
LTLGPTHVVRFGSSRSIKHGACVVVEPKLNSHPTSHRQVNIRMFQLLRNTIIIIIMIIIIIIINQQIYINIPK